MKFTRLEIANYSQKTNNMTQYKNSKNQNENLK